MSTTTMGLHEEVDELFPGVIADRRHLHQHPELAFHEYETSKFVAERLAALGVEDIRTGVGKTGVTGIIRGSADSGSSTGTIMLRADMDALPILEQNDMEFRSQSDGVMHACGHDSHVAMLLGATRLLAAHRDQFSGQVKVLFQPAEEGGGGARAMIADGVLEDPPIEATFGIHIWQHADVGTVEIKDNVAMVGADGFTITIQGKGGHGAKPQKSIDPIVVGSAIINELQTLISREKDPTVPGVVTVGSFQAGNAANVIPDTAVLAGTIRTMSAEQREELIERVADLAIGVAASLRANVEIEFGIGAPPTVNDPAMAEIVRKAARQVVGTENVIDGPLKVVSEDYSEFLARVPGCFYFVGSRNEKEGLVWGHHHPRFDIDEESMAIGVETMTRTVIEYFNQ